MRHKSDSQREAYIVVGDFRDRLDHALAAVRRLMRDEAVNIDRVDALYRRRPETGLLRIVVADDVRAALLELRSWADREDVGLVVPSALPATERGFFFAHYLPQFRPLVRSYNLPQTALCALTCAFIGAPTPVPVLAEGTGKRAVVLEWRPGLRRPRDVDRDRCEASGSIELGDTGNALTPTS